MSNAPVAHLAVRGALGKKSTNAMVREFASPVQLKKMWTCGIAAHAMANRVHRGPAHPNANGKPSNGIRLVWNAKHPKPERATKLNTSANVPTKSLALAIRNAAHRAPGRRLRMLAFPTASHVRFISATATRSAFPATIAWTVFVRLTITVPTSAAIATFESHPA